MSKGYEAKVAKKVSKPLSDKEVAEFLGVVLVRKLSGNARASIARAKAYLETGE